MRLREGGLWLLLAACGACRPAQNETPALMAAGGGEGDASLPARSQVPRTASAAEVNETNPIQSILDHAVRFVENTTLSTELKETPGSIDEAAKAVSRATHRRIHEQVRYKGWWLFSTSPYPLPEGKIGLRFHDGYGVKPGTRHVYGFGFW